MIKKMKTFINRVKLLTVWIVLVLLLDFIFGETVIQLVNSPEQKNVYNPIYDHSLKKNLFKKKIGNFGDNQLCTNKFGFKTSCENIHNEKSYDLAFIGDSFTEGVGLSYEESFVGIIDESLKNTKIVNLGVSSYSPSIYLAKLNYLINKGFKFKEVVVYLDISDIQDEAIYYKLTDNLTVKRLQPYLTQEIKIFLVKTFPISYKTLSYLKNYFFPSMNNSNEKRSEWTYNLDSDAYGDIGVSGSIEKSILIMDKLYQLLSSNDIKLSIGVYPWPNQLKFDSINSIQVEIWNKFSKNRNLKFYNSFPSFYKLIDKKGVADVLEENYIKGDIHFNSDGAQIIANDYLNFNEKK